MQPQAIRLFPLLSNFCVQSHKTPASWQKTDTAGQLLQRTHKREMTKAKTQRRSEDMTVQSPLFWYELLVLNLKPCNAYYYFCFFIMINGCFLFVFIAHRFVEQILLWKFWRKKKNENKMKKQEYFSMEDWKPALGWDWNATYMLWKIHLEEAKFTNG